MGSKGRRSHGAGVCLTFSPWGEGESGGRLAELLELCRDVVRASHKVLSRHHVLPEQGSHKVVMVGSEV